MTVDQIAGPERKRLLIAAGGAGALSALLVSGLAFGLVFWADAARRNAPDLAELDERMGRLEETAMQLQSSVVTLQESAAGEAARAGQLIAIQGRLSELAGATDALTTRVGGKATREELGLLNEAIAGLRQESETQAKRLTAAESTVQVIDQSLQDFERELDALADALTAARQSYQSEISALRGAQAKAAAAALIAREIETAIDEGREFVESLDRLTRVLDGDERLVEMSAPLQRFAVGVASVEQLADDLERIRGQAAAASGGENIGWIGQTVDNLRALVNIEGAPAGLASFDQALQAARNATLEGDLAAASGILAPHRPEHPELADWLGAARDRQAAVAAIAEIGQYLDELLSRQG